MLIRGRRAPIVGSVCMDMMMVDVTRPRRVAGRRGRHHRIAERAGGEVDRIDAREMAAVVGTIPWEIVCRIGARIERVYT